jgi:hypothetical protein
MATTQAIHANTAGTCLFGERLPPVPPKGAGPAIMWARLRAFLSRGAGLRPAPTTITFTHLAQERRCQNRVVILREPP